MNSSVVAGLLKRVYKNFDMLSFENRLKLQKFLYLMKAYKLDIGYDFSLYSHGPYSTELAKDGFQIKNFNEIKSVEFVDAEAEDRFKRFIDFINPHKDDPEWLEIATSLHLFKSLYTSETEDQLVKRVKEKNEKFSSKETRIREIFQELRTAGFI